MPKNPNLTQPTEKWVEWLEPFDSTDFAAEIHYVRATDVVKHMQRIYTSLSDEDALNEFLVVNWGRLVDRDPRGLQ